MPCHAAIAEKSITLKPDTEVEVALKELKRKNVSEAAVIDDDGNVIGIFSLTIVMKNLLPVSVPMSDGIVLDVTVRAAPGIAKRLKKVNPLKVEELMERKVPTVHPDTPIWEAVSHLVSGHSCLVVVEGESRKYLGMVTPASAMDELKRLQESEAL